MHGAFAHKSCIYVFPNPQQNIFKSSSCKYIYLKIHKHFNFTISKTNQTMVIEILNQILQRMRSQKVSILYYLFYICVFDLLLILTNTQPEIVIVVSFRIC